MAADGSEPSGPAGGSGAGVEVGGRVEVHRLAAFASDPAGGNPAGVVVTEGPLDAPVMLEVAAAVGYSETAFLSPRPGEAATDYDVRYFSPRAEVSFCGHATIAAGVLLGRLRGGGGYVLHTGNGPVAVEVTHPSDGPSLATLVSVPPHVSDAPGDLVAGALAALGWAEADLERALPPAVGFAGARHLILGVRKRARLADLDYDFDVMSELMGSADLTTVALVWQEAPGRFHARNLFPPGGVVEDPATGAAAAAFGAYLRARGLVPLPGDVHIEQGTDMGRPSSIAVHIPAGDGGIAVSGTAVPIPVSR